MKRTDQYEIIEGYIPYLSYRTWYRRIIPLEKKSEIPLLILHGGPGMGHNYLKNLEKIAESGREVIFYDQIGCGKSEVPEGVIDWNEEIWENELVTLRNELQLEKVHILGQSWGGMLAMQYAEHKPQGVKGLIISSSPASMKLWEQEAHRLINLLPEKERDAILRAEKTGDYQSDEYQEALNLYYARHLCNIDPLPEIFKESLQNSGSVYLEMEGPSEFTVTGKLKYFDVTNDLYKIENKTLLISGTDDEATPLIVKEVFDRIPNCRWILMDGTHGVHLEKEREYIDYVVNFLDELERKEIES